VERWIVAESLTAGGGKREDAVPGDHRRGRLAFVSVGCATCHFVPDIDRKEQKPLDRKSLATVADRMEDARVRALLDAAGALAVEAEAARGLLLGDGDAPFAGGSADRAAVVMLRVAAAEFANRALTHRQRRRAAAVLTFAADRLQANLRGSLPVRRDDFFKAAPGDRAAAEEFAEALITAAVADPEEAKLPHYGALLANVACHDGTDRALAMLLARWGGALSWRQLQLLALFASGERFPLRAADYHSERRVPGSTVTALSEVLELERQGLLLQTNGVVADLRDLIPAGLAPMGVGQSLVKRLGLNRVPADALEALAALLR